MMQNENSELLAWRAEMQADLESAEVARSTRALLALTYDDPDRERVESILLRCISADVDPQVAALAVTCIGHLGRIHLTVGDGVAMKVRRLLDDPILGGQAEDALTDLESFVGNIANREE